MAEKKNKPEIRFKGFSEEWEERELENEVDFFSGLTYSPSDVIKEGGTFVLRSSNVKNGEIVYGDNVYVNSTAVNSDNVREGDIIVVVRNGSRSLIGKHAQIKKSMNNTVIGAFMTGLHSNQSAFINALLNTMQFDKEIEKNLGATINQITTGAFKRMQFMFPNSNEQSQIGTFFSHLDTLITLHQRKYDKLVTVKKAMLEKMFPQNGAVAPEIRFKGFTEAWGQQKLGSIYTFQYGQFNNNPSDGGIYPVYGANGIIGGYSNFNTEDSVVIGHMGENAGSVLWGEGKHFVTYNGTISLPKSMEIIPKFGYYMLFQLNINKICGGSGQPFLSYETLQQLHCVFPMSMEEQIKIAEYFKNIDNLITLKQRKLVKLKNIKKACLEKMFV